MKLTPASSNSPCHPSVRSRAPRRILATLGLLSVALVGPFESSQANVIINGDFDNGLTGWTATADNTGIWSSVDYMGNIGTVGNFTSGATATSGGNLTQSFLSLSGALELTFSANWLYGPPDYGAAALGVSLLDGSGNGYAFTNRRNSSGYGVIWYKVTNYALSSDNAVNINTSQDAASVTGTLTNFTVTRSDLGEWTFSSPGWASSLVFTDTTTSSFTQLSLMGLPGADNSISVLYDNVSLQAVPEPSALLLGALGISGVLLGRRRR